jgi:L-2-hydroxycarboxylate dehydrogenase (NAD+)
MNVSAEHLFEFTKAILKSIGCPEADAHQAAEVLLSADLRGVDSHGVARLSGYIRLHEKGRLNVKPNVRIVHETPSTAVVDGDAGLGLVVGPIAMDIGRHRLGSSSQFQSLWNCWLSCNESTSKRLHWYFIDEC